VLYRHTQMGWVFLGLCFVLGALLVAIAVANPEARLWPVVGILILLLLAPYKLTVTIDHRALQVRFGPGLIGRSFPLDGIETCAPVRNPWWWGWGIKMMWGYGRTGGWLFSVSGLDAVELRMKNGRYYRIGTDQPAALCQALNTALQGAPASRDSGRGAVTEFAHLPNSS
jgi:hypothetical protein